MNHYYKQILVDLNLQRENHKILIKHLVVKFNKNNKKKKTFTNNKILFKIVYKTYLVRKDNNKNLTIVIIN